MATTTSPKAPQVSHAARIAHEQSRAPVRGGGEVSRARPESGGPTAPEHIRVEYPYLVCASCGATKDLMQPGSTISGVWSAFVRLHASCSEAAAAR